MIGEEILIQIDQTLDQLIRNAEIIQKVDLKELSENEIEAFQKTQESLLHHFLHMDQHLEHTRIDLRIQDRRRENYKKYSKFEKLKSAYYKNISEARKRAVLSKRKTKRLLEVRDCL